MEWEAHTGPPPLGGGEAVPCRLHIVDAVILGNGQRVLQGKWPELVFLSSIELTYCEMYSCVAIDVLGLNLTVQFTWEIFQTK